MTAPPPPLPRPARWIAAADVLSIRCRRPARGSRGAAAPRDADGLGDERAAWHAARLRLPPDPRPLRAPAIVVSER
ncbi:hypothetical protein ACPPVO_32285 [Dactylosporangium sp. McL0621]|uniref:hypothetical protein n=1 Tax=Dactylosporangium sp. McL0621 TaxID=3415678 RepID=UPI003CF3EAAA